MKKWLGLCAFVFVSTAQAQQGYRQPYPGAPDVWIACARTGFWYLGGTNMVGEHFRLSTNHVDTTKTIFTINTKTSDLYWFNDAPVGGDQIQVVRWVFGKRAPGAF